MLSLAYPRLNLTVVVWLWMLPLLFAVWSLRGRKLGLRGFGLGWLAGVAFFAINLSWLWEVSGLGAIAVGLYLATYWGLWGWFAARWGNPLIALASESGDDAGHWKAAARSLRFAFMNAAVWVGLEWLRGWVFTGFGWNGVGAAFHDTPTLAQAADLFGVTGLSFVPVFLQCVMLQTGWRLAREARSGKFRPHWDFGIAVTLLAATFFYGVWRLRSERNRPAVELDLLMIQRNIPQDIKWNPLSADEIYSGYSEATDAALAALEAENQRAAENALTEGRQLAELRYPDLVLWPESALPYPMWYLEDGGYPADQINIDFVSRQVIGERGFGFIVGVNERELELLPNGELVTKDGGGLYNSIVLFPESMDGISSYRKVHLVPFGEYIPLREQIPLFERAFQFSAGADFGGNFRRGQSTDPLTVDIDGEAVGIIPAVCFEDTVGRLMRKFVRSGPQFLVNLTNDGWFGESAEAEQHLANARFRCIELRRPMVRAANTGVSCLIDTTGSSGRSGDSGAARELRGEDGTPFVEGHLFGRLRVPREPTTTLYAVVGDVPVVVMGVLGLVLGWLGRERKRSERP